MNLESGFGGRASTLNKNQDSMLQPLEKLKPLTQREKLQKKLSNFLKVKLGAYGMAALVGIASGTYVQNVERGITGYNPAKHARLLEKKKVESPDQGEPGDVMTWFERTYESLKKAASDPRNFIEDIGMYKTILEKYYVVLKLIDDVAFIAPALLIFIMLGGYLNRRLVGMQGDTIARAQNDRIISKVNELIVRSNALLKRIDEQGVNSLSPEEIEGVQRMLIGSREALPDPGEIDGT